MIIRALITGMALLLAGYAFWDGALSGGHVLNPFGILFLFLSGLSGSDGNPSVRFSGRPEMSQSSPRSQKASGSVLRLHGNHHLPDLILSSG
jgi:hypothetical protein